MSMAIVDPALSAHEFGGFENAQLRTASFKSLAPTFLTICAISCAMAAAGCARNPAQRDPDPVLHEGEAAPVHAARRTRGHPEQYRYAEPRLRRPDPALLAAQPAPDCEFTRS